MSSLPDAKPLLFPASYVPTPLTELAGGARRPQAGRIGVCICGATFRHLPPRGPVPKRGPCCVDKPAPKAERTPRAPRLVRATIAPPLSANGVVEFISRPGCATVAFDGGITLFVGSEHFQAHTITEAVAMASGTASRAQARKSGRTRPCLSCGAACEVRPGRQSKRCSQCPPLTLEAQ